MSASKVYQCPRAANSIMAGMPGKNPVEWYVGTELDSVIDRLMELGK